MKEIVISGITNLKHLSSKPRVSLEMIVPTNPIRNTQKLDELNVLEMEIKKVEVLLKEMTEIRSLLNKSLEELNF